MATCSLCKQPFDYPDELRNMDRAFAKAIGGQNGETCDECTAIIVDGSSEELGALLARTRPANVS